MSKKTSGFEVLMRIDDQIISIYNWLQRVKFLIKRYEQKYHTGLNKELKNKHLGERCFIVGNGPSIKTQDLTLLKDEWTFCVNYFYHHPKITEINPKYYAIVDPKLSTGEWPISMLDEIIENCPQATLLLAATYQDNQQIQAYAEDKQVYWIYGNQFLHKGISSSIDITKGFPAANVITLSVFTAIYMGFSEIYLLGVDCDGIFRDLLDESSHFYQAKKENIGENDPELVAISLRSSIQCMRGWGAIAEKFNNPERKIVNLTAGGLLNAFPREDYTTLMTKLKPVH